MFHGPSSRAWMFASVAALAALLPACGATGETPDDEAIGQVSSALTGPAVTTQRYDIGRTGANLSETTLTTSNVKMATFGKVYTRNVRGSIYAQPLYVPSLTVSGAVHNVVFVATMHDYVYAFDADLASASTPLWSRSLGTSMALPDSNIGGSGNVWGEIGILSTPVISTANNAMYVVAMTKTGSTYQHTLYKLNLQTGANLVAPIVITDPGFDSSKENQRSALLLVGSTVYLTFASFGDNLPYSGYVFAYDATTLAKAAAYRTSDSGQQGGIWMAGTGASSDGTDIYFITGNGQWGYNASSPLDSSLRVGESIVRMNRSGSTLSVKDWFTPNNHASLNAQDGDLGASGAVLVPGTTDRIVGGGKEGIFFLLNKTAMGYTTSDDHTAIQKFHVRPPLGSCVVLASSGCNHIHGSPVFWTGPTGQNMYVWPENDFLRSFKYDTTTHMFDCGSVSGQCTPSSVSTTMDPESVEGGSYGMPGGFLAVSANGSTAGTGIVWASHAYTGNAALEVVQGILRAYDASDLTHELWNSRQNPGRDDVGAFAKYAAPTVTGGHVYQPAFAGLSGRVKFTDTSPGGPALAPLGTSAMVLAWRGTDSHVTLKSTTDGFTYGTKTVLTDTTSYEVSAAGDGTGHVYLAWTGSDGHMNVASSTSATFATFTRMNEKNAAGNVVAFESTNQAPAIACGNGKVFIAWRDGTFGFLNVMSSSDGVSFKQSTIVTDTSDGTLSPMGLYYADSRLYMTWLGSDLHLNVMSSINDGASWANKVTLSTQSAGGRALLVGRVNNPGTVEDLHFVWDDASSGTLEFITAENPTTSGPLSFGYLQTISDETSSFGMAATKWKGQMYVGWTGQDNTLTVARFSPGEYAAFGNL